MGRRIKSAKASRISLVQRGANRVPVLYKAETSAAVFDCIVKADADKGELLNIVYVPEFRDTQGDIASADVIRKMAHDSMRDGPELDLHHNGVKLSKTQAYIAESFIVQPGDARFTGLKGYRGEAFNPAGSWATLIKVDDPAIRADIKSGKLNGVSIEALNAELFLNKSAGKSKTAKAVRALADMLGLKNTNAHQSIHLHGDIDMTPEELKAELAGFQTTILKEVGTLTKSAISTAVTEITDAGLCKAAGVVDTDTAEVRAAKLTLFKAQGKATTGGTPAAPAVAQPPAAPEFKGDLAKAEDVAAFEREVKVFEIRKAMDPKDPASVKKAQEAIAALDASNKDNKDTDLRKAANVQTGDTDEVVRLKLDLHKAQQRSNQPAAVTGTAQVVNTTLTKDEQDALASGLRMADYCNGTLTKDATAKVA